MASLCLFDQLPDELVCLVLEQLLTYPLAHRYLFQVSLTCKRLKRLYFQISTSSTVWFERRPSCFNMEMPASMYPINVICSHKDHIRLFIGPALQAKPNPLQQFGNCWPSYDLGQLRHENVGCPSVKLLIMLTAKHVRFSKVKLHTQVLNRECFEAIIESKTSNKNSIDDNINSLADLCIDVRRISYEGFELVKTYFNRLHHLKILSYPVYEGFNDISPKQIEDTDESRIRVYLDSLTLVMSDVGPDVWHYFTTELPARVLDLSAEMTTLHLDLELTIAIGKKQMDLARSKRVYQQVIKYLAHNRLFTREFHTCSTQMHSDHINELLNTPEFEKIDVYYNKSKLR